MLRRLLQPRLTVSAHCDLPCGVYDPAQARIEAESVAQIQEKYQDAANQKQPSESEDDFAFAVRGDGGEPGPRRRHHRSPGLPRH